MIAEVIVDILNNNVDRIYDYALPPGMEDFVGGRVLVNFSGRNVGGIIVNIKAETQVKNIKSVIKKLDDQPIIGAELLGLMWHMAKDNHMLLADILRLFIPSEMRNNLVREKQIKMILLSPEADLSRVKQSAKKQWEAIEFLNEQSAPVSRSYLCSVCSASAVDTLIEKGIFLSVDAADRRIPYKNIGISDHTPTLTESQSGVVREIVESSERKFLLHGVTGSGKTEVYMQVISDCVADGKTAVMLVPEIALTPQMLKIFRGRYGRNVAILHSGLSAGERFDEWWRLKNGEAKIAIGARSAIFAPLENIGVIIIDEEHDQSYIPDSSKFTTFEVASFRSDYNGSKLILGSATPSVSTFYSAKTGELKLLSLPERINRKPLPQFNIVDMRSEVTGGNNSPFSALLKERLDACLKAKNQAMLFINRRGYSSVVMCPQCGYVAKCDDCDVSLTYHRDEDVLKCHYCDKRFKMLDVCPNCKGVHIRKKGIGTERIVGELEQLYPPAKILRMDNDTTSGKEGHAKIVKAFSDREADILVGTQMIAKGHDFKDVALVGILDADLSLYFSDYRSVERTFQLITQVAGRAGRADVEGQVVLQTYSPKHYIYALAEKHDYFGFYEREIALREATNYPPFARIVRIVFSAEEEEHAIENLKNVYLAAGQIREKYADEFIYLNRMKSPIKRLQGKYRYQILARIKRNKQKEIIAALYDIVESCRLKNVSSYVEIDPNNMS